MVGYRLSYDASIFDWPIPKLLPVSDLKIVTDMRRNKKLIMRKSSGTNVEFVTGQVWQLADSKLEIGLVGRTLVHYKHYKGLALRPPTQLSSKTSLQKFLSDQEAVLLAKPPVLGPAGKGRGIRPAPAKPAKATKSTAKRAVRK